MAPGAWEVTRSSSSADDWWISFALSVSKIWTNIDSRNVSHSITCNILQYLTIWINCCTTCRHLAYSAWTCPAQGGLSPGSATQWDEKRTVTVRYEHNSYSKCFRYVLVALNGCKMLAVSIYKHRARITFSWILLALGKCLWLDPCVLPVQSLIWSERHPFMRSVRAPLEVSWPQLGNQKLHYVAQLPEACDYQWNRFKTTKHT